jgi:hypothetical protein
MHVWRLFHIGQKSEDARIALVEEQKRLWEFSIDDEEIWCNLSFGRFNRR